MQSFRHVSEMERIVEQINQRIDHRPWESLSWENRENHVNNNNHNHNTRSSRGNIILLFFLFFVRYVCHISHLVWLILNDHIYDTHLWKSVFILVLNSLKVFVKKKCKDVIQELSFKDIFVVWGRGSLITRNKLLIH